MTTVSGTQEAEKHTSLETDFELGVQNVELQVLTHTVHSEVHTCTREDKQNVTETKRYLFFIIRLPGRPDLNHQVFLMSLLQQTLAHEKPAGRKCLISTQRQPALSPYMRATPWKLSFTHSLLLKFSSQGMRNVASSNWSTISAPKRGLHRATITSSKAGCFS